MLTKKTEDKRTIQEKLIQEDDWQQRSSCSFSAARVCCSQRMYLTLPSGMPYIFILFW